MSLTTNSTWTDIQSHIILCIHIQYMYCTYIPYVCLISCGLAPCLAPALAWSLTLGLPSSLLTSLHVYLPLPDIPACSYLLYLLLPASLPDLHTLTDLAASFPDLPASFPNLLASFPDLPASFPDLPASFPDRVVMGSCPGTYPPGLVFLGKKPGF